MGETGGRVIERTTGRECAFGDGLATVWRRFGDGLAKNREGRVRGGVVVCSFFCSHLRVAEVEARGRLHLGVAPEAVGNVRLDSDVSGEQRVGELERFSHVRQVRRRDRLQAVDDAGLRHANLGDALVGDFELGGEVLVDDVGGCSVAGDVGTLGHGLGLDGLRR